MKILAFDTSSNACSVALLNGSAVHSSNKTLPMQQAKLILPMIHTLLDECSVGLEELDAIAFGCGPGSSFTGIRIATSVAQGLGFATQKRLISVSSLAALAQTAYLAHGKERVFVAVDARMESNLLGDI